MGSGCSRQLQAMSKARRWRAVSSALSKCRHSLLRAHMQTLCRRSAAGSVMQMLCATTVSDVRCLSCSPAHPGATLSPLLHAYVVNIVPEQSAATLKFSLCMIVSLNSISLHVSLASSQP